MLDEIEYIRGSKRFYWTFWFRVDDYQMEVYVIDNFGDLIEVDESQMIYSTSATGACH